MSWNGEIVIDLDPHIVERLDRFYQDYIAPSYRDAYVQLCDAVAQQSKAGHRYSATRSSAAAPPLSNRSRPAAGSACATPSAGRPATRPAPRRSAPAGIGRYRRPLSLT